MSIYNYIYLYIYLYISIYILKKNRTFLCSFAKERNVLAVFSVLCKRMLHSLRFFPFFAKECCIFDFFSVFRKERKRREHSFLRTEKNVTYQMEKNGVPNPAIMCVYNVLVCRCRAAAKLITIHK